MWNDINDEALVGLDREIQAPVSIDSSLPNVPSFVVFLSP
jgi:hypothetical protein